MRSDSYTYFSLKGDFDPDVVAAEIGLEPTSSRAKHSRFPDRQLPACSALRFAEMHASPTESVADIYVLADQTVSQLEPLTQQFTEAIEKHQATACLQVVLWFPVSDEVSTPILGFSNRVIRFLAATGASIDIDSYRK